MMKVCFVDIDECLISNGGCNQICSNSYGSFECSCGEGYSLAEDNFNCDGKMLLGCNDSYQGKKLADVDECQTSNGGCNQTCSNSYGSFECSCGAGYTLASDNLECDGK